MHPFSAFFHTFIALFSFRNEELVCLLFIVLVFLLTKFIYFDRNLQAAICSYFEFQSTHKLPNMTLVKDVTIGEGESVPPDTRFVTVTS